MKIVIEFEVEPGETKCVNCMFFKHQCTKRFRGINCDNIDLTTLNMVRIISVKEDES